MFHTKLGGLAMQLQILNWVPRSVAVYHFGRNKGRLKHDEG